MDYSNQEFEHILRNLAESAIPFEIVSRPEIPIGGFEYAIAIPAQNERARIIPCLQACMKSMQTSAQSGVIVLAVNNTNDETVQCAVSWADQTKTPIEISYIELPAHLAHAGAARRLALDRARCLVSAQGALLTTDADSLPDQFWVAANLRVLGHQKLLVCGNVGLDQEEILALPPGAFQIGHSEHLYKVAAAELENLLDPDPLNSWPHHGQASGASLAMKAFCYDAVGGLPIVECGEDRALAQIFRKHDFGILFSDEPRVTTSCRLHGRAAGGMADTISYRMANDDFPCDEALEKPSQIFRRATLRSRLRSAMAVGGNIGAILKPLALTPDDLGSAMTSCSFGALWFALERDSPALKRERMTRREMESHMPELAAMLREFKSEYGSNRKAGHGSRARIGELCNDA